LATFLRDDVERQFLLLGPRYCAPQRLGVVGVNAGVVPGAGYRDIELPVVDQLDAAQRIDVDNYPVIRSSPPAHLLASSLAPT